MYIRMRRMGAADWGTIIGALGSRSNYLVASLTRRVPSSLWFCIFIMIRLDFG